MICNNCFKSIPEDSSFCHYCGVRVEKKDEKKTTEMEKEFEGRLYRRLKTSIIYAVILAVLIGAFFALVMPEDEIDDDNVGLFLLFTFFLGFGLSFLLWYCVKELVGFVRRPFNSLITMMVFFLLLGFMGIGLFNELDWDHDSSDIIALICFSLLFIGFIAIAQMAFMNKFLYLKTKKLTTPKFWFITLLIYTLGLTAFSFLSLVLLDIIDPEGELYYKAALPIAFVLALIFFHTVNVLRMLRMLKKGQFRGIEAMEKMKRKVSLRADDSQDKD